MVLLEDKKKRDKALHRSLFLETGWAYQQKDIVGRDLIRTQKETAHVNIQQIMLEQRVNELNIEAVERELDLITSERTHLEREMETRKKSKDFAEKIERLMKRGIK